MKTDVKFVFVTCFRFKKMTSIRMFVCAFKLVGFNRAKYTTVAPLSLEDPLYIWYTLFFTFQKKNVNVRGVKSHVLKPEEKHEIVSNILKHLLK